MIQTNSIFIFFVILLLAQVLSQTNICSIKCRQGACTDNDTLICTACNDQQVLVDGNCIQVSGQHKSIKYYYSFSQNKLINFILPEDNRTQIICQFGLPQAANMTFFNQTISTTGIYFTGRYQIEFPMAHQYIQIRMNAILFNQRTNPQIEMLVYDENLVDLFDQAIQTNVLDPSQSVQCFRNNGFQPASYPFFINQAISTSANKINIEIQVNQVGDQLGISNFQIFYGNCFSDCQSCYGPGPNQCLSCKNLLRYDPEVRTCAGCPPGFYYLVNICRPCPYNCQQCQYNNVTGKPVCITCIEGLNSTGTPECLIYNQKFQDFTDLTFNDSNDWVSNEATGNIATICGRYSLAGGIPLGLGNSLISKQFTNLRVHEQIWIKFTLMAIDQQPGSVYRGQIRIDGEVVQKIQLTLEQTQQNNTQCGTQLIEYVQRNVLALNIPHTRDKVQVAISGENNFFGIRDFVIGIQNLTDIQNCVSIYQNGSCSQCNNGLLLREGNICSGCPQNYYLNTTLNQCMICPLFCRGCQQNVNGIVCTSCHEPLSLDEDSEYCVDQQKSIYALETTTAALQNWQSYPKLQQNFDMCGDLMIMGSSEIRYRSIWSKKVYQNVPPHQGVIIYFIFAQIDNFGGIRGNTDNDVTVYFKINDKTFPYTVSLQGKQLCGNSTLDQIKKVVLNYPQHTTNTINFQVHANRVKFGINRAIVFLQNCPQCDQNIVDYDIEAIPVYQINQQQNLITDEMKFKLIFEQPIQNRTDKIGQLFSFNIQQIMDNNQDNNQQNRLLQATGNLGESPFLQNAFIKQSRQLIGNIPFFMDKNNWGFTASPVKPDQIFSYPQEQSSIIKPISISKVQQSLPRFDYIDSEQDQANMRNLRNFFRGIAVLGMWIGMISFLFGISSAFDDLFILTQIIFVHVFIQSQWLAATFKIPLSGMKFVQFLEWLPDAAKNQIQSGILPDNHYQRSPIVYEQFYKDITFARTIYHTVLFIIIIIALYLIIRLVRAFTRPTLGQIIQNPNGKKRSRKLIQQFYFFIHSHTLTYIERFMRFIYFTVIWACVLQFIWFENLPVSFFQWNAALCIIFFIIFIVYPIASFIYLNKKAGITSGDTFNQLYFGIRIRRQRLWYYLFKYIKLIIIALLIGLLYKANPLAVLIPLMVLHLIDAAIILFLKPFHLKEHKQRVLSFFGSNYWVYYKWSHFIQNILFFVLELILVIMYARRSLDDKRAYFSIGYAACAFVVLLLINGLIRVGWTIIRYLEICYDDVQSEMVKIESDDNDIPINEVRNMNPQTTRLLIDRNNERKPSIEQSMAHQFGR